MAVQSDDAAAPGPCGHAKVELSDPLRRQLPTPAPLRPASKSVGRFAENWGCKAAQTIPYQRGFGQSGRNVGLLYPLVHTSLKAYAKLSPLITTPNARWLPRYFRCLPPLVRCSGL